MTIVANEVDQQPAESTGTEQRMLRDAGRLPASRIVLVPFALVEVEFQLDDE